MILSLFFISSTFALFITPQKWIERRIGLIQPRQKSSREIVSIRAPNQNFYKSHEKTLKKEICNIQTCSKCVSLLSYSAAQNFRFVELCEKILSLRTCCPQKIIVHARFWNLLINFSFQHCIFSFIRLLLDYLVSNNAKNNFVLLCKVKITYKIDLENLKCLIKA